MNRIILAPHGDDEIIGCYTVLRDYATSTTVIYVTDLPKTNDVPWSFIQINVERLHTELPKYLTTDTELYVPNIFYEFHPLHHIVASIGMYMAYIHNIYKLYLYSTTFYNMKNVLALPDYEDKKKMLEKYYINKASLWAYEHKYFLFESISEYKLRRSTVLNGL